MSTPIPSPASGDYRDHEDYRTGAALRAAGQGLPVPSSTLLMRGFLDSMTPQERPDWTNGPGMREPFTQLGADMVPPAKSHGAANRDAAALASLPRTISIFGDDGKLLRPDELKGRYLNLVLTHCSGDRTLTSRLLDLPRRTVQRIAEKRWRRP